MSSLKTSEITSLINKVLKESGRLRKGGNLTYHCPFCNHRKRKLEVCVDEPYVWHCWTCDAKGRGLFYLFKKANASQDIFAKLESIVGTYTPKKANLDIFARGEVAEKRIWDVAVLFQHHVADKRSQRAWV